MLSILGSIRTHATTLNAGDVAIAGVNSSNPDGFSVVTLVNLDSGTQFTLTDKGWLSAGGFRTGEGTITYTAPSDIRAGTILTWVDAGGSNSAGFSYASEAAGGGTAIGLNKTGESLAVVAGGSSVVSGSTSASSILWGVQTYSTAWDADAADSSTSARPGAISATFSPVIGVGSSGSGSQFNNGAYSGVTTATDKSGWQTRIGTVSNSTTTKDPTLATLPTGSFNVISSLTWNASINTTWDTATTNKNFTDGTNTTWFNGSDNVAFGSSGVGTVAVAGGGVTAGTVSITNTSGNFSFSGGSLAGTSLAKSGNGTATIGNAASFSSGASISAGTLLVSGSLSGSVSVTGGTLGGSGVIGGAVSATTNGTISPGSSPGKLTLQTGLDLSGGGTYLWQLGTLKDNSTGTAGTDFDQLSLTGGNLKLGGSSHLTLDFSLVANGPNSADPFWLSNHSWAIIAASGSTNTGSTNFFQITNPTFADGSFATSTDSNGNATLQFQVVPEPQTWLTAFSGLSTLILFQRNRFRQSAKPR